MHINLNPKSIKFLNPKEYVVGDMDDFFTWRLNYIIVKKKKLFALINDATRFCVVIYDVKDTDFTKQMKIIKEAITLTMEREEYNPIYIKEYIKGLGDTVTFGKDRNKHLIATHNDAMGELLWITDFGIDKKVYQLGLSHRLNETEVETGKTKPTYRPNYKMETYLEDFHKSISNN